MQHLEPTTYDVTDPQSRRHGPPPPVEPPPPKPVRRRFARGWFVVAALAGVAAIAVGGYLVGRSDAPAPIEIAAAVATTAVVEPVVTETPPATTAPTEPIVASDPLFDASVIGQTVVPSVVTVQVSGDGFGGSSGSGVIYDTAGHVVTNDHVVDSGRTYRVVLSDGRVYDADLVGSDPTTDLAVLRIGADTLVPIGIGETTDLLVGDPAVAVGSPLGLQGGPSLTVGVLSAFGREVRTDSTTTLFGMLQTDAPITQGSSGGALVDEAGRLIGITTAVGVSSVGIEGIGFATPIEIVARVADEIIATGEASQPFLGITGITAFDAIADGGERPVGVTVESVQTGSGADIAGLAASDVITSVAGERIDTMDELIAALRQFRAGQEIEMSVLDAAGADRSIFVTLGDR